MTKELEEAWNIIRHYNDEIVHTSDSEYVKNPLEEEIDIVNNVLLEFKTIKESNPGEALKSLEYLDRTCGCFALDKEYEAVNTIKQTLLKAQEQKMSKELEFIKLLCKHYYINSITGELKENTNKRCGNEDEIYKLNRLFEEFKEKSK